MSSKSAEKIRLRSAQLEETRSELQPLIELARIPSAEPSRVENAAARAMLHSFYSEPEHLFEVIAGELDGELAAGDMWHRKLLRQMATATDQRPAVISTEVLAHLDEYLSFRHVFRNASIIEMKWAKLVPLLLKFEGVYSTAIQEIHVGLGRISPE